MLKPSGNAVILICRGKLSLLPTCGYLFKRSGELYFLADFSESFRKVITYYAVRIGAEVHDKRNVHAEAAVHQL